VVTAALLSGFLLIDGNPGTALEVWPLRGSGEAWALLKNLGHRLPEVFTVVRCQWREKAAEFGVHLAWKAAAARRPVSVGVTRSARRSPGIGDRFTRPRRSALSIRPVSTAFSTSKQRASSATSGGRGGRASCGRAAH
jgi:hypothetical protein